MARFILSAFADEADKMLDGQIEAMKENGVACVELRGVDGKNVKDLTDRRSEGRARRLDAAGIRVSSMGSPFGKISVTDDFEEHLKQFAHALELCKVLGCDRMRMFSFYYPKDEDPEKYQDVVFERIEKMLELAEKAGCYAVPRERKGHLRRYRLPLPEADRALRRPSQVHLRPRELHPVRRKAD